MVLLLVLISLALAAPTQYSVVYSGNKWEVKEGNHFLEAVATASWEDTRAENGWTRLKVTISKQSKLPVEQKFFGAGYLEGYITQKLTFAAYYNFVNGTSNPLTTPMQNLVNAQLSWMQKKISSSESDPYWIRLGYALAQYNGMMAGYQSAAPGNEKLTTSQLMAYVLQLEIGDYAAATQKSMFRYDINGRRHLNKAHPVFETNQGRRRLEGEHCSVLIKPSSNGNQLLASHDTWSAFNTMLRVFKTYDFPTGKIHFSSFPGLPISGDDWFINNDQLLITETTNEIFNMSTYQFLTAETIPYWLRVQVANDASTAPQWHQLFEKYNNGGYNNQWMVVDYKLYTKGKALVPNTLVVGEQAPGLYVWQDQTSFLTSTGYWGSYNVPYYKQIWLYSGYEPMYQKYGNSYSWSECARARIYRRDQHTVQDLPSLKKMQRYNSWQTDPFALHDACRGISARCDLNNPWQNGTMNGMAAFGGIDCKAADDVMVKQMITHAVSGPSYDSQPIFWWSQQWASIPHRELPQMYAFDFVEMTQ